MTGDVTGPKGHMACLAPTTGRGLPEPRNEGPRPYTVVNGARVLKGSSLEGSRALRGGPGPPNRSLRTRGTTEPY